MSRTVRTTRRELVAAGSALALSAAVPDAWAARLLRSTPRIGAGRFLDGVASGEPSAGAVTFWGRLTTDRQRSGARLVVATDEGLSRVVATTVVPTSAGVDGALKARVDGLEPDTPYFYAWQSAEDTSPVGRTKTAPAPGSAEPVALAFSSCQRWSEGFFTGHRDAAAGAPLDLYVFLGDYTYEYEGERGVREDLEASDDLQSYRDKLRLYRSDAGLRELHRLQPVVHVWDDHEVADNHSDNAPRPSDAQRAAAYQASFEWLPRITDPRERYRTYGSLLLGGQAEVLLLDQRQYRTGSGDGRPRSILGRTQLDWLKARLTGSRARWKLVANQAMIAPLGVAGVGVNDDQWDGYPDDRREVLDTIAAGVDDVVFLTGDIHTFFTAKVLAGASSGPPVATEYVGGSISSSGLPALAGLSTPVIQAANPWITYANGEDHGYGRIELSSEEAVVTYRTAPVDRPDAPSTDLARYRQPAGANDYETVLQRPTAASPLPAPPAARALRPDAAPTRALARRRRAEERLAETGLARLEAQRRGRRTGRGTAS